MQIFVVFVCVQALIASFAAAQTCEVNVTQGTPWTSNGVTYNFARLDVSADSYVHPGYPLEVTGSGPTGVTWHWNATSKAKNISSGNALGYYQFITPDTQNSIGVVMPGSAKLVGGVKVAGETCDVVMSGDTISGSGSKESAAQAISISGSSLIGVDGLPLSIKGINWFGFETPSGSFMDGLWAGTDSITKDFATIVYRLQLLGFNAVRLPMSFSNLFGGSPNGISQACNVDSIATIASSTVDPAIGQNGQTPPAQPSPPTKVPGQCSADVPSDNTLNRFLYVVNFFARNNFYVVIDNHLALDATAIQNPTGWVGYWKQLAQAIANDPISSRYTILDILNEPDAKSLRWEAANGLPGAGDLYLQAMDAIYSVNPSQLMAIEATGQASSLTLCWVSDLFKLATL